MAFAAPSSGLIVQTGRDANLSGLIGNTGVTVTQDSNSVKYYDFGTNRLEIRGTVFHDPENEVMLFHSTAAVQTLNINQSTAAWNTITTDWTRDANGYLVINSTSHGLSAGDCIQVRLTLTSADRYNRISSVTANTITLDNSTEWDLPTSANRGQFTWRACYNYGKEVTNNGKTRTARGTGLYFTGESASNFTPGSAGLAVTSGYLWARGGTIMLARPATGGAGGSVDIKDLALVDSRVADTNNLALEFREFPKGFVRNLILVGIDMGNYNYLDLYEFTLLDSSLIESLGTYYEVNLTNLDTTSNVRSTDIGCDSFLQFSHRYYKLYNSVQGSSIRSMWRGTRSSSGQINALEMYKTVKPTVLDTEGIGVTDTKIYVQDTPSAYAKKGYISNQNMFYVNGFVKSTNTTPPVVTILDHGLSNDQVIAVFGFNSSSGVLNGDPICGRKKVTVIDSDTITLQNLDGTDVVGAQTFDLTSVSDSITNITNNGGRVQLTVSTDFTSVITANTTSGNADRVYIRGIVGGSSLEAFNGVLHPVYAITATTITLHTTWPSTNNTYTGGGIFNKVYKDSFNTTTTYDYLSANIYQHTTDSNGEVAAYNILIGTQIHDWTTQEPAATIPYGGPYDMDFSNGSWRHKGTSDVPAYSDWDTTRFGGFYKVDRRGVGNTDSDIFKFQFCNYNKALTDYSPSLVGANTLSFNWVMFDDASITETNKATVDAYTTIDSPEQFYDRAKSYLYDNYAGETATIVTRNGTTINAGSYNIVVDASAASVFAFDGSTITIKSTQFVGNITTSGTFTLLNGAEILGTYGSNTVLPWTITNVEAGSTIQIYNDTQDIEIENYITSGSGTKITAIGSYSSSDAVAGDTIRLRITYQAGVNALLPFEVFGVATSTGISFRADQVNDTVYNANNIDGGSITGITVTPDYTNIQIDIDDNVAPYEITAQQIYNYYAYIITTTQGIANFYGAITPIDRMNYRINSSVVPLKIQNTGTTDVVINGGRLYRDDNVSIIDTSAGTGAGTGSLVHDTGFLLQYIQPQVESATASLAQNSDMQTVKTDVLNIKKKTNLITALI